MKHHPRKPSPENARVHRNPYRPDPRQIIRDLSAKRGFRSDRQLAIAAGIAQPTLARYLNGTSKEMEVPQFAALAETLQVTISELLGEVSISETPKAREMTALFSALGPDAQDALLATAKAMAPKPDQ